MWASRVLSPLLSAGSPGTSTSPGSMRTPSKASSASVQPRRPILRWVPATLTPSRARSTTTAPMPLPVPASLPGEAAPHQAGHRLVPAGDVVLVGVEPPAVAVGGEVRPHGGGGRAGIGLGDADAEQLPGGGLRQPPGAQGVVAEVLDGAGRPVEDQLAQDGARHVDAGDLLEDDGRLDVAHAHAAVLLAHGDGEQLGPPQGLEGRLGELLGLVPARRVGGDVALGHVAGQLAQRGPVVVLDEVDGAHGVGPDTIVRKLLQ